MDFSQLLPEQHSRRDFLKSGAAVATGFVIGFHIPAAKRAFGAGPVESAPDPSKYPPNAFIQIAPDNSVTITINKLEMGQGVNTSMAQYIVEELDVDWTKVSSVSAGVNPVYNHIIFPMQLTGGSGSLTTTYNQFRTIGAAMKQMLLQAAAKIWDVPVQSLRAEKGYIFHKVKGKISYGELASVAQGLPFPKNIKLKKEKDFKVIGKSVTRVDAEAKSNGKAVFGIDVKIPGMQYAVVTRPPVPGAKLKDFSKSKAKSVSGVTDVVQFGDSVAVIATNTWAAIKGREALKAEWDLSKYTFSSDSIMADFKKELSQPGVVVDKRGDGKAALSFAKSTLVAEYEFPYLAHAAMEPLNCTIHFDGKKVEIWSGHQMPTADLGAAASVLQIPPENVKINTVYAGGSFGRRANKVCDYVVEAASLAKVYQKPVKITWTREDDMRGGFYRPMNYHRVELGFDEKNGLVAWYHRMIGQSVIAGSAFEAMMVKDGVEATAVEGVAQTPYELKNFYADSLRPTPNVTTLWWRSVGHTHTAYVMETMIDELAHKTKQDALQLRKKLLKKSPRHLAVLNLLERHSPWGKTVPKGHALGLAIHESFNSVVGHVVEVSFENSEIKLHRVVSGVDCGRVVNPAGAAMQIESAIVYALSAAMDGEIKIENGQVTTSNFHDYPVTRMPQMPKVEVHFVQTPVPPTGLGEPGVPPLAPAMANALFKLTGKRLRKMPFSKGMKEA